MQNKTEALLDELQIRCTKDWFYLYFLLLIKSDCAALYAAHLTS